MQALILKDFYVMWKQTRVFLLVILVFSAIPGSFNAVFAVIYSAMLPYTAMAYDERSKVEPAGGHDALLRPGHRAEQIRLRVAVHPGGHRGLPGFAGGTLPWYGPPPTALPPPPFSGAVRQRVRTGADAAVDVPLRHGAGRLVMFLIIFLVCGSAGAVSGIAPELDGQSTIFASTSSAALAAVVLTVPLHPSVHPPVPAEKAGERP